MKGFFTQGGALLLKHKIDLSELEPLLQDFGTTRRVTNSEIDWTMGGDSLVVSLQMDNNGTAAIDVVPQPWPDAMGDPKGDATLFASWSMGHFGPLAWPGALERAIGHSWTWPEGRDIARSHAAFVRVKVSHAFGASPDDPVRPANYDAVKELHQTTRLLLALAAHPAVIAWFNPNGEVLLPPAKIAAALDWAKENQVQPVDAWSNVRMLKLDGVANGWMLMDTVGLGQADAADHEIFFREGQFDCNDAARFLRNSSSYILSKGPVIKNNDTMDGPGNRRWQARSHAESFHVPPRPTLRWFPEGAAPPDVLLQDKSPLMH